MTFSWLMIVLRTFWGPIKCNSVSIKVLLFRFDKRGFNHHNVSIQCVLIKVATKNKTIAISSENDCHTSLFIHHHHHHQQWQNDSFTHILKKLFQVYGTPFFICAMFKTQPVRLTKIQVHEIFYIFFIRWYPDKMHLLMIKGKLGVMAFSAFQDCHFHF